ncbi:cytochrome P450 [Ceratobasidium sp. AG-I]|nr:cytochrome P450 [Ceratobasidium sp. AG-I]
MSRLPLPPGPPRWSLIGALLSMPRNEPNWTAFVRWGKETGNVVYAPVLGQDMIILNSREAAVELLEKRSVSYSDRPRVVMAGELMGWDQLVALNPYNDKVRRIRKLLHDGMSPKLIQASDNIPSYAEEWWPLQEQEALKFLQRLLHTPEDLISHIRQTAGATVVKLTYGYTVKDNSDEYIRVAERALNTFSTATTPGAFLVDVFPSLKYVPWAPFKQTAVKWRGYLTELIEMPMKFVHDQMEMGSAEPSLVSRWLEQPGQDKNHESIVKWAAASLYSGGTDTTVAAITTFFLAMVHNPSAQAEAQAEIERIIGADRLPTYSDRSSLPYVDALYKEVLRWQPLGPFGVPHKYSLKKDDEYLGMRIPAGATVIANAWGMLQDPEIHKDPTAFNPNRFAGLAAEPNPEDVIFGFGRRRCPGIAVAQSSTWLSIALTLAAYNVTPATGSDGKPIIPSIKYSNSTISHPEPFQCNIAVRSERIKRVIEDISV